MMNVTQSPKDAQEPRGIIIYWHTNQLAVTHHSSVDISEGKQRIIESLDLISLGGKLRSLSGLQLEPFTSQDITHFSMPDDDDDYDKRHRRRRYEDDDDERSRRHEQDATISKGNPLHSTIGKYFFPHPSEKGTIVVSFFHISGDTPPFSAIDGTSEAVNIINGEPLQFSLSGESRLLAASPNWLNGGAGPDPNYVTVGCPASPPIPASDPCSSGNWHITLPAELPETILNATGEGVQVFVLDTLPTLQQISDAVIASGSSNPLLVNVAENVTMNYQVLSDVLDVPGPDQPATGNDIHGNLVGFPMNDHGLFIAGIIRDLAPAAQVECIRVLNDYAVGDTSMLLSAFSYIHNRFLDMNPDTGKPGDLCGTPVVVNMSLTTTLPEEALAKWGFTDATIAPARMTLLFPMQALAEKGVVFTASSGNGSGPRDLVTDPPGERLQPRYPAAFAYPLPGIDNEPGLPAMIPVGAVNKNGLASSFSNYPGELGIGAYGGDLPQSASATAPNAVTGTVAQQPLDAIRGVYTAPFYPSLSVTDPLPVHSPAPVVYPLYQPAPVMTWAYWMGTSFATPIISALAARVMETQPSVDDSVRSTLLAAAPSQVDWTNLDTGQSDAYGPMVMVNQECQGIE
ncbi:MAG: S8/S53 family peptidase [Ktedonobacteraceae bacterium]|nr:S8/S53 family peptidase [Ktedonobacteraceae bacterium]